MLSEMTQSLHTKKQDSEEGLLAKERREGLSRSRSLIIAVGSPVVGGLNKTRSMRGGSLTFSNSVRSLSRAGTSSSRRLLVEGSSHESAEEALSNSLHACRLSVARPSPRRNSAHHDHETYESDDADAGSIDDFAEETSAPSPERPIGNVDPCA
jgi:hypothetical protein